MSERGGEVGGAQSQKLLSRVQLVSVPCGKRARGRHALDISKRQTTSDEWNDPLDIPETERPAIQRRQSSLDLSRHEDTEGGERARRSRDDR